SRNSIRSASSLRRRMSRKTLSFCCMRLTGTLLSLMRIICIVRRIVHKKCETICRLATIIPTQWKEVEPAVTERQTPRLVGENGATKQDKNPREGGAVHIIGVARNEFTLILRQRYLDLL